MNDCVFCRILAGEIPSHKLYEDERMIVIEDIDPKAAKHYLMIPKRHYKLLADMTEADQIDLGKCLKTLSRLHLPGTDNGYRLVINQGDDAGQTVFHLHVHVLCGQRMEFPHL